LLIPFFHGIFISLTSVLPSSSHGDSKPLRCVLDSLPYICSAASKGFSDFGDIFDKFIDSIIALCRSLRTLIASLHIVYHRLIEDDLDIGRTTDKLCLGKF